MSLLTRSGMNLICSSIEVLEKGLNFFGYVPVAGTLTAKWGRGTLVKAQIVSGIAFGIFSLVGNQRASVVSLYRIFAWTMLKHGLLNSFRSAFEIKPFLPLVTLLPFDLLVGRAFPYPSI